MKTKTLSILIKIILIGFALLGIGLFAFALPDIGQSMVYAYPEYSGAYWPWLIFLWIAGIPCYAVLVMGWLISVNIARDNAFCQKNAKLLKAVAILSAADAAFFFVGNLTLALLNWNHPGIFIASLSVVFIGIAISVASLALSQLTVNATEIQDENALTI